MGGIYSDRGTYLGSISSSGEMYNDCGDYLGRIETNGSIYDYRGNYLGSIWSNGYIYLDGQYAGMIDENGYVYRDGSYVGHIDGYRGSGASNNVSREAPVSSSSNERSEIERKAPDVPLPDDGTGCIVYIVLILLAICAVVAAVVIAFYVAVIVAVIAALAFVVSIPLSALINKFSDGKFKTNPHARAISMVLSVIILIAAVEILDYAGVFNSLQNSSDTMYEEDYTVSSEYESDDLWDSYIMPERELYYEPNDEMFGDDVRGVQLVLMELGFIELDENGDVSGIFDAETEAAVREYQRMNDLDPDGIVAGETLELLQLDLEYLTGVDSEDEYSDEQYAENGVTEDLLIGKWNAPQVKSSFIFYSDGTYTEYGSRYLGDGEFELLDDGTRIYLSEHEESYEIFMDETEGVLFIDDIDYTFDDSYDE